jgi:hypothetical protein
MLAGHEKSPSGRQTKKPNNCRAPTCKMLTMHRDKEFRIVAEFFARPDVPTSCLSLRRVTKAVDWQDPISDILGDSHLQVQRCRDELSAVSFTDVSLLAHSLEVIHSYLPSIIFFCSREYLLKSAPWRAEQVGH